MSERPKRKAAALAAASIAQTAEDDREGEDDAEDDEVDDGGDAEADEAGDDGGDGNADGDGDGEDEDDKAGENGKEDDAGSTHKKLKTKVKEESYGCSCGCPLLKDEFDKLAKPLSLVIDKDKNSLNLAPKHFSSGSYGWSFCRSYKCIIPMEAKKKLCKRNDRCVNERNNPKFGEDTRQL